MKNKWIVGSFYTENTIYKEVANKYLIPSCEKLEIQWRIAETSPNYGNWNRNVAEKPSVILDMLNTRLYPDECLVFLDADAEILRYPELFDIIPEEYDIAFHTLNWNEWYGYSNNPPVMELLTGTMFFRNNNKIKVLCKEWYEQAKQTRTWEQKILERIIKNHNLNIYPLPLDYCYIESRPNGEPPLVKLDAIILHHNVGRQYKRRLI